MVENPEQEPTTSTPKDTLQRKLEARLVALNSQADDLEKRAEYAEKESSLRERIDAARKRMEVSRPPSMFDFPHLANKLSKGGARVLLIMGAVVGIILLLVKACGSGGG